MQDCHLLRAKITQGINIGEDGKKLKGIGKSARIGIEGFWDARYTGTG